MLQDCLADIVPVQPVALPGVGGREGGAVRAIEQPLQQGWGFGPRVVGAEAGPFLQDRLNLFPCALVDEP